MSRKYFGTDGVRGVYGSAMVNETFAARLALAAASFFREREGDLRSVVIGRDTRSSGESLVTAIVAALVDAGCEVYDAGIAPTPAIAGAMKHLQASMGIVITASHNPAADNGIKFFGTGGQKLTDADEEKIEHWMDRGLPSPSGGGVMRRADILEPYIKDLGRMVPGRSLSGWKIVVDAAHGATVITTPAVLRALGAELVLIGAEPNGHNINNGCGSLHPEKMAEEVVRSGARLGIAHDGDGDRLVLCDETGSVLDGDDILAILGVHGLRSGQLKGKTLVATVQSNLGLDAAIEREGGAVRRTAVGDRYVIEAMLEGGWNIGGESSGHLVLLDHSPTGDGLAGALQILSIMLETGETLSELRKCWRRFPQAATDVVVGEKRPLATLTHLPRAIAEAEALLGQRGRVLVRYSGTEPKLRILVEGDDGKTIQDILASLRGAAVTELAPVSG